MFQNLGLPPGVSAPPTMAVGIAFTEGPACAANGDVYFTDIVNNRILLLEAGAKYFRVFRQPSGRANGLLFDGAALGMNKSRVTVAPLLFHSETVGDMLPKPLNIVWLWWLCEIEMTSPCSIG